MLKREGSQGNDGKAVLSYDSMFDEMWPIHNIQPFSYTLVDSSFKTFKTCNLIKPPYQSQTH